MLQRTGKGVKKMSSETIRQRRQARMRPVAANESLEPRWMLSASVLSYHNDAASDGQNTQETVLTPSNVNSTSFGKVFTTSVDGNVLAQPLFMPGLNIAGGVHDVVFAATEHDSVYALEGATGAVLWHVSLLTTGLPGATPITTIPSADVFGNTDRVINPEVGITCTPVINGDTLYVVAATKEIVNGVAHYVQRLHALNILTGAEKLGGPVLLGDTTFVNGVYANNSPLWVNGTGDGNDGHGHVFFNVLRQLQRSGLTFANGQIYIAWSSYSDISPYHGWVAAFNASTLALTGVLNTTPNGSEGSIWMSGGKLSVDGSGNLYFQTGNGTFDGNNTNGVITGINAAGFPVNGDYGDSVVKIATDTVHNSPSNQNINGWGMQVVDYFTPYNQLALDTRDRDLASGGVALLPAAAGDAAHPNLLLAGGKQGRIYLLDQGDLGKFSASPAAEATHVVVETNPSKLGNSIYSTPSYFNQQFYYVPMLQTGKQFFLPNGKAHFKTTPVAVTPDTFGLHDATTSISSNGLTNGIVWAVDFATNELRAYLASNFNDELYTSAQAAGNRDALGTVNHFPVPTVVNGHVYVGTTNSIVGFGLLNPSAAALAQVNSGPKSASTVSGSPSSGNPSTPGVVGSLREAGHPSFAGGSGSPSDWDNLSAPLQVGPPAQPDDSSELLAPSSPIDWPWIGPGSDSDSAGRLDWLFPV